MSTPTLPTGFARAIIVITTISAAIMELIDVSIVNVALSDISGNLGATIEDAAWVVALRSRLLARLEGKGATLGAEMSSADLAPYLARWADRLAIAAMNGPRATVVSGDIHAVESLLQELEAADLFARQ